MIGNTIDKYEVLDKIGEGGMAVVYLGRHTTLNRQVAIKVLHPHLASSEKNRTRFAREARAIESLRHPNILRIFDYSGVESEHCFIVTEFIEGPTLRALLDDVGAMMAEPAALIARELCAAMQSAHNRGIVHRDLKPENVMIDRGGSVKLMDFGIARILDDSHVTMTGALVGSPAYMSPEQATDTEIDQRSDLFALGTVLYRMVTGTLPFRGGNPSVVLKAIIDGHFEDPTERVPSLSPAMASVIRKCLAPQPAERYADANQVMADLDLLLASVDIDGEEPDNWAVARYLEDSDGYEEDLREHLITRLVARGRNEVDAKMTASALRTFNRVLALDEENREVIEIIEGMKPPLLGDRGSRGSRGLWLAVLAVVAIATLALGLWSSGFQTWGPEPQVLGRMAPVPMPSIPIPEASDPAPPTVETTGELGRENDTPAVAVDGVLPQGDEDVPLPTAQAEPRETRKQKESNPDRRKKRGPPESQRVGQTSETSVPAKPVLSQQDREARKLASLDPALLQGAGRLRIVTLEGNAPVIIDGDARGWTPMAALELSAGYHTVELPEGDYHLGQQHRVLVTTGNETDHVMKLRYKPSIVVFEGFPEGTQIEMNERDLGLLSALGEVKLTEMATYRFAFRRNQEVIQRLQVVRGVLSGQLQPGGSRTIRYSPQ